MSEQKISDDESFEVEKKKKIKINFKSKKVLIPVIAVVLMIMVILVGYIIDFPTNMYPNVKGYTMGNLYNCGYSVTDGEYIYYVSPNETMEVTNLYRSKIGGNEHELIFEGNMDIRSLNIIEGKLYFIAVDYYELESGYNYDAKMYKMDLDGSNQVVINDNDFSTLYVDMYAIKNKIYYIGADNNLYRMNLNGKKRKLILELNEGVLGLNENYVIYIKDKETYVANLNGKNEIKILDKIIYTPQIQGDYIYYTDENMELYRIPVVGGEPEKIIDVPAYDLNVTDNGIYYLSYRNQEEVDYSLVIYKADLDGGNIEEVQELEYATSFIDVLNNKYIYYMDSNGENQKIFLKSLDIENKTTVNLYEWNYGDYSTDPEEPKESVGAVDPEELPTE